MKRIHHSLQYQRLTYEPGCYGSANPVVIAVGAGGMRNGSWKGRLTLDKAESEASSSSSGEWADKRVAKGMPGRVPWTSPYEPPVRVVSG